MKWINQIESDYLSDRASVFILYGNVHDLFFLEGELLNLSEYLSRRLPRTKEIVVSYNLSQGLQYLKGNPTDDNLPRIFSSVSAIDSIESLLATNRKTAVVIEYAETLFPSGDNFLLSEGERSVAIAVHEWSQSQLLPKQDNMVILITEHLNQISDRLKTEPRISLIEIPLPNDIERQEVINKFGGGDITRQTILTSGLKTVQLLPLIKNGTQNESLILKEKAKIIKKECADKLEIVNPSFGFEAVAGIDNIKSELLEVAEAIRNGNKNRVPMGILLTGAMGTGKSHLTEAFAKECGVPMVKLANFKSPWVGSTENNFETILRVIKGLGQVIVVIDEVERAFGNDRNSGDPTASPIKAKLKEFMSDKANRGRILFMLMSNRPDYIDVDLKRSGRLDLKIPLFYCETHEERMAVLRASYTALGIIIKFPLDDDTVLPHFGAFLSKMQGYSNSDIAEIARFSLNISDGTDVKLEHLARAVEDFSPSNDVTKIQLQEYLAVFETSNKRFLPDRFKNITSSELNNKITTLKLISDDYRN